MVAMRQTKTHDLRHGKVADEVTLEFKQPSETGD